MSGMLWHRTWFRQQLGSAPLQQSRALAQATGAVCCVRLTLSAWCACRFMIAFWPVWGLLTLPITALFVMGILFSAHFIPVLP